MAGDSSFPLLSGSLPSRWGHPCGVEDCLSSIGPKVSCPHLGQVHWSVHGWLSRFCLQRLCAPCPSGCVARSSLCRELRLSLAPSSVFHCPVLWFSVASTTLAAGLGLSWVPCPTFCRLGFCSSVGGSACALQPLAPSYRFVHTEAAGLGGVLGSLHCAPLFVGPLPGPPALLCLLSASCFFWAWSLLLRVWLRPLPGGSLSDLWLPVRLL